MGGEAVFALPDLDATSRFAKSLVTQLVPGDVLLLSGDLGAGKTAFARALIQEAASADTVVTSPTFTLMQPYGISLQDMPITCWHIDLYRIESSSEIEQLGLEEIQPGNLLVIEWPERLEANTFQGTIGCHLQLAPDGVGRMVSLSFAGHTAARASQVVHAIRSRY